MAGPPRADKPITGRPHTSPIHIMAREISQSADKFDRIRVVTDRAGVRRRSAGHCRGRVGSMHLVGQTQRRCCNKIITGMRAFRLAQTECAGPLQIRGCGSPPVSDTSPAGSAARRRPISMNPVSVSRNLSFVSGSSQPRSMAYLIPSA